MPHQCVRCKVIYDDGAKEILKGCTCGGRLFFFISQKKLDEARQELPELKEEELKPSKAQNNTNLFIHYS